MRCESWTGYFFHYYIYHDSLQASLVEGFDHQCPFSRVQRTLPPFWPENFRTADVRSCRDLSVISDWFIILGFICSCANDNQSVETLHDSVRILPLSYLQDHFKRYTNATLSMSLTALLTVSVR